MQLMKKEREVSVRWMKDSPGKKHKIKQIGRLQQHNKRDERECWSIPQNARWPEQKKSSINRILR